MFSIIYSWSRGHFRTTLQSRISISASSESTAGSKPHFVVWNSTSPLRILRYYIVISGAEEIVDLSMLTLSIVVLLIVETGFQRALGPRVTELILMNQNEEG